MSKENALFEDEFDFDDDGLGQQDDLVGQLTGPLDEGAGRPSVELPPMEAYEGGDRAIPAISVLAFCESNRVCNIIARVQFTRIDVATNFIPVQIIFSIKRTLVETKAIAVEIWY